MGVCFLAWLDSILLRSVVILFTVSAARFRGVLGNCLNRAVYRIFGVALKVRGFFRPVQRSVVPPPPTANTHPQCTE